MRRILLVSLLVMLMFSFCVSVVSAAVIIPASCVPSPLAGMVQMQYVYNSVSGISGCGVAFTSDYTCYLDSVTFSMAKVSEPDGFMVAKLYSLGGGVAGSNAYPSTTVLDTSGYVSSSVLTGSTGDVQFVFSGDYQLQSGTSYCMFVYNYNATINTTNYPYVYGKNSNVNSTMNVFTYNNGWQTYSTFDLKFVVTGDTAPNPTSTPTPSPVPVTVVPSSDPVAVPSYYMVVLVLFAVVAVLAGIYVGFERDGGNKGVAFLFALVALVIFVVLIVGYLSG